MSRVVVTRSEAETVEAGRDFSRTLGPGSVVLLSGDLGAGKTAFIRGMAAGLGIDPLEVTSPTFTLIHEYRGGRLPLHHVDLYRLAPAEVDDLGLDDLTLEGGIIAIEWPDRLPRPLDESTTTSASITARARRERSRSKRGAGGWGLGAERLGAGGWGLGAGKNPTHAFQACSFNHSDISPCKWNQQFTGRRRPAQNQTVT